MQRSEYWEYKAVVRSRGFGFETTGKWAFVAEKKPWMKGTDWTIEITDELEKRGDEG